MAIGSAAMARGRRIEGASTAEPTVRRGIGWVLLLLRLLGGFGLVWDEVWHARVGRDQFFTPPHVLLYANTALTGLLCLAFVLWESHRFRQDLGVHDGNTVRILRVFHAPLGIVVAGFGALTTALAAPLDNYWHELYGIDVTLWAPFHVMGFIGGLVQTLGLLYYWAALLADTRRRGADGGKPHDQAEVLGVLLSSMFLLGGAINLMSPAFGRFPVVQIDGARIMLAPVLLALAVPGLLIIPVGTISRPIAAAFVALLLLVHNIATGTIIPWAVRAGAAAEGLSLRTGAGAGVAAFGSRLVMLDVYLLLVAVIVAVTWPDKRTERGIPFYAAYGAALGVLCWLFVIGVRLTPAAWGAFLLAFPFALGAGGLSGLLGRGLAEVLHRNPR